MKLSEQASGRMGFGRRLFLKVAGLAALSLSLPARVKAYFEEGFPVRTVERDSFVFDHKTGFLEWKDKGKKEPYLLTVKGLVETPASFSYQELLKFQQVSQVSDFHCVEGWSVADVNWVGFRTYEIVKRVKPKPEAQYVVFHALGETTGAPQGQQHYVESMPLSALLDPGKQCLLALFMNGAPLPRDHGAPLRLVSPYDLGYKNIKFVHAIEFTDKPRPGWWTLANPIYPVDAPVPAGRLRKKL